MVDTEELDKTVTSNSSVFLDFSQAELKISNIPPLLTWLVFDSEVILCIENKIDEI